MLKSVLPDISSRDGQLNTMSQIVDLYPFCDQDQITSNASASVPAPTSCISHADMPITPEDVVQCFADSFLHKYSSNANNDKVCTNISI